MSGTRRPTPRAGFARRPTHRRAGTATRTWHSRVASSRRRARRARCRSSPPTTPSRSCRADRAGARERRCRAHRHRRARRRRCRRGSRWCPVEYSHSVPGSATSSCEIGTSAACGAWSICNGSRPGAVLLLPLEAAAHAQQVVERDLLAWVAVRLPFLDGRRGIELESTVADQHPDDRRGEALGDRERRRRLIGGVERVVTLVDDLTALDDDERTHAGVGVVGAERGGDGGVERHRVDAVGQFADRPLDGRIRDVRRLLGIVRSLVGDRQGRCRGVGRRRFRGRGVGRVRRGRCRRVGASTSSSTCRPRRRWRPTSWRASRGLSSVASSDDEEHAPARLRRGRAPPHLAVTRRTARS